MSQEKQPSNPNAQQDNQLTISDIESCMAFIELASSRGAVNPKEMAYVGSLYNKLAFFVSSAKQAAKTTTINTEE